MEQQQEQSLRILINLLANKTCDTCHFVCKNERVGTCTRWMSKEKSWGSSPCNEVVPVGEGKECILGQDIRESAGRD